jgi:hypothetical protein
MPVIAKKHSFSALTYTANTVSNMTQHYNYIKKRRFLAAFEG